MMKIGTSTYDLGNGFFAEKMADGTWTAYQPIDADDRYLWRWSSPKHSTLRSAKMSASFRRRALRPQLH